MPGLSRRLFLAATASAAAAPALAQRPAPAPAPSAEVDVAIVGAGAAGIAAARRVILEGRRVAILEASDRIGGRCITDTAIFGVPFDLGAHWLHAPDINPLAKFSATAGVDVYPAPRGQKLKIGRRYAREGETEDYLATVVRANRAILDSARGTTDVSCARALPKDLGEWKGSVEFLLGPFGCAKDLSEVSAADFAKSGERDLDAFCRQGLGALLGKLAEGLPVQLGTPVLSINSARAGVEIETPKGKINARAVVVTASTNVLAGGTIKFGPELPKRQLDALQKLSLGSYERIALELQGNPLNLQRDDLVFEKTDGIRTASILANVSGTSLTYIDVAGSFGRELASRGRKAMTDFAAEWLGGLFGTEIEKSIKRTHATQWFAEPFIQGAFSAASVGGQPSRRILMEPLRERIFFAGEAVHEMLWGTVGGAWESGDRAAIAALRFSGVGAAPAPEAKPQKPTRQRRAPRAQTKPEPQQPTFRILRE
jgi:monoamine oxidase